MKRMTIYEMCLGLNNERLCGSADTGDAVKELWSIIETDPRLKEAGIKIHYVHGPDCAIHAEEACDGCADLRTTRVSFAYSAIGILDHAVHQTTYLTLARNAALKVQGSVRHLLESIELP